MDGFGQVATLALVLSVLVSGCAQPSTPAPAPSPAPTPTPTPTPTPAPAPTPSPSPTPPPTAAPAPPAASATPSAPKTYERTFELNLTGAANVPHATAPPLNNCVLIQGNFTVLRGSATATWTSQSPATAQLELHAMVGRAAVAKAIGPSPLTVSLVPGNVSADRDAILDLEFPSSATPTAAVQQAISLAVTFDYLGGEPTSPTTIVSGCQTA